MKEQIDVGWFARLPKDLAWDIFTLISMVVTVSAMGLAVAASMSAGFAQHIADSERWIWIALAILGIIALVCLLRLAWADSREIPLKRWG